MYFVIWLVFNSLLNFALLLGNWWVCSWQFDTGLILQTVPCSENRHLTNSSPINVAFQWIILKIEIISNIKLSGAKLLACKMHCWHTNYLLHWRGLAYKSQFWDGCSFKGGELIKGLVISYHGPIWGYIVCDVSSNNCWYHDVMPPIYDCASWRNYSMEKIFKSIHNQQSM